MVASPSQGHLRTTPSQRPGLQRRERLSMGGPLYRSLRNSIWKSARQGQQNSPNLVLRPQLNPGSPTNWDLGQISSLGRQFPHLQNRILPPHAQSTSKIWGISIKKSLQNFPVYTKLQISMYPLPSFNQYQFMANP